MKTEKEVVYRRKVIEKVQRVVLEETAFADPRLQAAIEILNWVLMPSEE